MRSTIVDSLQDNSRTVLFATVIASVACGLAACGADADKDGSDTGQTAGIGGSESGGAGGSESGGVGGSVAGASGGTGGTDGSGGAMGGSGGSTGGSAGSTQLPPGTFLADQYDHIVFEIETAAGNNPPSPWEFKTTGPCQDPSNCEPLGSGFYQYKGANPCGQSSSGNGVVTVEFEVKTAGRYRVVWRNLRDHRDGGCGDDRNNDSFMAFPTTTSDAKFKSPFKVFGGGSGTWNWSSTYDIDNEKQKVCLEFAAGVHTMAIQGRSRDHAIDKVALFRVDGSLDDCRSAGTEGLDAYPTTR